MNVLLILAYTAVFTAINAVQGAWLESDTVDYGGCGDSVPLLPSQSMIANTGAESALWGLVAGVISAVILTRYITSIRAQGRRYYQVSLVCSVVLWIVSICITPITRSEDLWGMAICSVTAYLAGAVVLFIGTGIADRIAARRKRPAPLEETAVSGTIFQGAS